MVKFKFSDIEMAFMFVNSAPEGSNVALLCKDTGDIRYSSDMGGFDDIEEGEEYDPDQCIEIPHKNELDLGKELVFAFVEENLPDDYGKVQKMFRKRGAYARFKDLLEYRGLLQEWHDFEDSREDRALREWCRENGIELEEG